MRSVAGPDDLTARARIRDAAVARFGRDGFRAGVRTVAEDAGVSPALVLHHFGSKQRLREACDEHVLASIASHKAEALGPGGAGAVLAALARVESFAPLAAYAVRSLQDGGGMAQRFVESFVADARQYLADGVAAGTIRPSRDEEARARWLAISGIGALLVHLSLHPAGPEGLGPALRAYADAATLPALEVYTEGLLADRALLDAYVGHAGAPPPGGHAPPPAA
ncbi:TetR/AcrR family transcriptional regulator [Cellulomonas olei]|uniref:TetR/AcrR family transcriptional regulator n=1 Tax=Cellulomonas sp. P4 TaxID=3142533 RepID=UPI0031BAAF34